MDPKAVKLLRYRYGAGGTPVEMQDRMQAAGVVKDISGKEDIHLSMLGPFEEPQTAFTPGDFIALKDQSDTTWSWGRVSVVRSNMNRSPEGMLVHSPYAVMVQGWYDFLSRSKIHVTTTSNRPSVGTLFQIGEWKQIGADLIKMYGQPPGLMLQFMLRKLLRIKLPPALGGGWFSDEIPVVYNRETALRYAPEFEDIEPVEFGKLMPQLAVSMMAQRSSDIGALIAHMFLFDNSLVELVPYLSTRVGTLQVPTTNPEPPQGETPEERQQQADQRSTPGADYDMRVVSGRTKLGTILNAQPVLVYRIKPFRVEPLYRAVVSKPRYKPEDAEAGYLDRELSLYDEATRRTVLEYRAQARKETTDMLFDKSFFRRVTFSPESIVSLPYSHIKSISRQRDDSARLNASSIHAVAPPQPSGNQITDNDWIGLPVTIDNQIENHGLRLRTTSWSLYPPDDLFDTGTPPSATYMDPSIMVYYRAVAAQVMQFYEKAHLYETGSMQLHFAHTLRFVESDKQGMSLYDRDILDLSPGRWFRTSFTGMDKVRQAPAEPPSPPSPERAEYGPPEAAASNEYYGYITSVSHNIQRLASGVLTANTQVHFMRGHFADMWDVVNGVNVPLDEPDRPPNGRKLLGQGRGGGRSCSLRPAQDPGILNNQLCGSYALLRVAIDSFNAGQPLLVWPGPVPPVMNNFLGVSDYNSSRAPRLPPNQYNNIAQNYVPDLMPQFLKCWFLGAISVMPVREYNEVVQRLSTYPSMPPAEESQRANLHALAACAYIIERYWRTHEGYDDVRLRIRSIARARDRGYHPLYAAMDFYLEYPPDFKGEQAGALQVWASLTKLADERRIPYGGRGLYLNVHPERGIFGTHPSEAGEPSKLNCQYPPGGSSWTHYDIRGMWGITVEQGGTAPSFFTSWAATDWNGDGSDEISLGSRFMPPAVSTQNGGVTDKPEFVWANVADPEFTYLDTYINDTTKSAAAPGVAALMRARKDAPNRVEVENRRVPVRAKLKEYFEYAGRKDKWLHPVTSRVPNFAQVFDLERLAFAQVTRPPTEYDPDKTNDAGELYIAKYADGSIQRAPMVVIFGGIPVNGERSGIYMKRYAQSLFKGNHVVIAKSDRIDYTLLNRLIADPDADCTGKPRTMYVFSNGVMPSSTFIKSTAGAVPMSTYSKVYLVDAYLGSNTTRAKDITSTFIYDLNARPQYYEFFYTEAYTENGMTQATRDKILGGGSTPAGIAGLNKISVHRGSTRTELEWHMKANEDAMSHLLQSNLTE